MYDISKVRADFPILSRTVYGKPLVYLDNAATTQKPLCVLDAMRDEYLNVAFIGFPNKLPTCTRLRAKRCGSSSTPVPLPK